ncbi:NAD(P)-dependent dehydrogenase (short-subunit alcohol dehydrogenase family) [Rathayibacter sp. PhB93]|uniref:glucose 1-dehydrogenase n=1 Tax=unclassified Rathayibacter TaxID=2609250 RepID=UPI000F46625E|nr:MULTISPECIES: glucose 1-dehydrogenase [unclassified Rathayibacter]ROQ03841.1 NAD(P)-dependent dehydrogenase (short-subunit alcohol dehydrogenase family) [Rathayibacter sp. PhB93]ROQ64887.1 NAD(P)-dependent dehydrogenase (short-subunit alcohol dehydrogenase family) [Rathayibacter sp. PhB152]ROS23430.1 NAD(P)-dependent dehydrogenase (short-subunit alcohol dehydrogenase family) [Rathayibacter sp. PhB127]TDQ10867.1 NAD(P)-dependent dehydrogenase (short-subunit alcohol dehydrogenase family) [Rath
MDISSTRFTDRVVLITGGGSGLGRATAVRLAAEGAKLALVDVSEQGLAATVEALPEGTESLTVIADVSKASDVDDYVAQTLARFGRIDGFFNNAGIEGRQNLTEDFTADEFDKVVAINLRGVFLGLEKVLKVMREQGSGMVVNTASVGGITGIGNQSGYAAAKHGVVGLTRNSGIEYGQYGIRINAIAPGAIWTPMVENSMKQLDAENPRKAAEEFIQVNPTKRYGEAAEIASVVAFLLSDDASYINAVVLPIDGGQSIKY